MNKIKKLFRAIGLVIRKPYLLNLVIDDNDNWKKKVGEQYGLPEGLDEIRFHDLSGEKEIKIKPFAFLEGGSIPTDLALLRILSGKFEACKYFEIGTWRGESVANVAEIAAECTTLNLPAESMRSMGLTEEYIAQHAMFSKELANVTHLEGDSADFDFEGLGKKFDLVFIDGDHHYEAIKRDTANVFRHLLHDNSIVVWHDYAWQPGDIRYETLAAIMAGTPAKIRSSVYSVRNTMCAVYVPGKVKSYAPSVLCKEDEAFEISLSKTK